LPSLGRLGPRRHDEDGSAILLGEPAQIDEGTAEPDIVIDDDEVGWQDVAQIKSA